MAYSNDENNEHVDVLALVAGEKKIFGAESTHPQEQENPDEGETMASPGENENTSSTSENINNDAEDRSENDNNSNSNGNDVEGDYNIVSPENTENQDTKPKSSHKKEYVKLKLRLTKDEINFLEEKAKNHGVGKYEFVMQRIFAEDGGKLLTYEEQVDEVTKKVGFLEEKLPLFEKLYLTTSKYVDKINLAFGELLKNISYFEERKEKILQQTKEFKVYLSLKEEDKKALSKEVGDMLEEYKCSVASMTEQGEKALADKQAEFQKMIQESEEHIINTIDEQLKKMQEVNSSIIQKVAVNSSFLDNINRIKSEYLLAFFAFLISGTILMTIIVTYLLQMK